MKKFRVRFGALPEGAHFGKLEQEGAVGQDDGKILVETGGELFTANLGQVERGRKVTCDE